MRTRTTNPLLRVVSWVFGLVSVAALLATGPVTQASGPTLEQGFREPPHRAQPRVWWHWMNGNVTKEGIQSDLEWMRRIGVGGFQNFDAGLSTPQIVAERLVFMTPKWKDAFRFTTQLADSLGLEMAIAGSPGWSESGGPWVPPADGMKKYVWSETRVKGGQRFERALPPPPSTTGTFQNVPAGGGVPPVEGGAPLPQHYQDAAVVAFRVPAAEVATEPPPKVTSSSGQFDLASLTDGDLAEGTFPPAAPVVGEKAWIQYEFAGKRRGYSMVPWLPVLTGRVVESAEASDRFLWDLRATLADLVTEYHYDQLTTLLHGRDMGRYTESHEGPSRAFVGDGMEVKRTADVPMSAMWTPGGFGRDEAGVAPHYQADVRESASVAHVYGQNLVAAESLTAIGNTWAYSPERLKPTADMELANGLNRFVIHTSVHQPVDDKVPGLGLGPFGQWFTRHETWAEQARPWITYLARSSFMLQQGRFVADVLYVYGEDHNVTALFRNELPPVPEGYSYDFLNAGAIASGVLSVSDGRITTASRMSYRLLALDPSTRYVTLPVLRRIRELVREGAVLVGARPVATPSLSDDEAAFESIAMELWGEGTGERAVGSGVVHAGRSIEEALTAIGVVPEFEYTRPHDDTKLLFVHRDLADGDVYWVNNRNDRVESLEATFRVEGRAAELWQPVTGEMEPASYRIADGRTTVPLKLQPNDAVFVVFREKADVPARTVPEPREKRLAGVGGPWEVRFQPERGAPPRVTFEGLTPWNESTDPGVKYFSGTATYAKQLQAPDEWFEGGTELRLDLGDVKNLAEVLLNGESLGIVWTKPFRVNMSKALRPGENALEIRVTNLWVNRLIGDQQPDAAKKYTYTTQAFYQADSPLLPSGLLGPVQVVSLSTR
jgi:hypothetical protein